jgi:hypothetical protein
VVDSGGRTIRSLWQTTPMVAEGTSLSEARRIAGVGPGPAGIEIEGLETGLYRNARLGITITLPMYPYVAHVVPDVGLVYVTDLMDEASVLVRPASAPRPPAAGPLPDAEAARQADLLEREWAARFEDVKAEPRVAKSGDAGAQSRSFTGTARLGCTTFNFRNLYLPGDGLPWFVSVTVADRSVAEKGVAIENLVGSIKLAAPAGQLPVQVAGDLLRSPAYGFEMRRPNKNWRIPTHASGPMTVLDLAREDGAAVVLVRVATPPAGQTLAAYVTQQATSVAESQGVPKPEPAATTLGGEKAVQIVYTGPKMLSGEPARCTTVFMQLDSRIFTLVLVVRVDADLTAAKDVESLRESLKFAKAAAGNRE